MQSGRTKKKTGDESEKQHSSLGEGQLVGLDVKFKAKHQSPRFYPRIGKLCALVAATLVLPAMALAGTDNGNRNGRSKQWQQFGRIRAAIQFHL
jgi:hypothetical protein